MMEVLTAILGGGIGEVDNDEDASPQPQPSSSTSAPATELPKAPPQPDYSSMTGMLKLCILQMFYS